MRSTRIISLLLVWLVVALPFVHAQAAGDNDPPVISDLSLGFSGDDTVVSWQTSEPSTTELEFGPTAQYGSDAGDLSMSTSHTVTVTQPAGERVYYLVRSCDAAGNCATRHGWFVPGPLFVQADVPDFLRSSVVDISGLTRSGADVSVFVNGALTRRQVVSSLDGTFLFRSVSVPVSPANITFRATLDNETVESAYDVVVDTAAPTLSVSVPSATLSQGVTANVTVDEPVDLKVTVKPEGEKPFRPSSLREGDVESDSVELSWDAVADAMQYVVYRDGRRIAVSSSTAYDDVNVAGGRSYEYQVTSISEDCIESDRSDILTVRTPAGQGDEVFMSAAPSCELPVVEQSLQSGTSPVTFDLYSGRNLVTFAVFDIANHSSRITETVFYDVGPPVFEHTNLPDMKISYERDVTIKGKVSEQAAITVIINGKAVATEPTGEDGSFSIPVELSRSARIDFEGQEASLETGVGWLNRVTLLAVDAAGREATVSADVNYALCGEGTWFDITTTEHVPGILTPRLLLEGLQQTGFGFTYEYRGDPGARVVVNPSDIKAEALKFSPEFEDDWDNSLIANVNTLVPAVRREDGRIEGDGYVQLELVPFDPLDDPDATTYEREKSISDHRRGGVTGAGVMGRMKFYLILNIPFTETRQVEFYDPDLKRTVMREESVSHTQKKCIQFNIPIDERIPPRMIPTAFLEGASDVLDGAIGVLDDIIDPVYAVGQFLFYGCVASNFLMFIPDFAQKLSCEFSGAAGVLTGAGFDVDVASVGACEDVYAGKPNAKESCLACQNAKQTYADLAGALKEICDRTMCPSPPTLQNYIKDKARMPLRQISGTDIYAGSDCSMFAKNEAYPASNENVQEIWTDYLVHKDDERGARNSCNGLHPATAECCGYEYMDEWSSACGISAFGGGIDTFDELKESVCLSAQRVGDNMIPGGIGANQIACSRTFNSISGMCEPGGGIPLHPEKIVTFSQSKIDEYGLDEFGKERFLYLFVVPGGRQGRQFTIKLGYLVEKLEFSRSNQSSAIAVSRRHYLTADLEAVEIGGVDLDDIFDKDALEAYHKDPRSVDSRIDRLADVLTRESGNEVSQLKARQVFERVVNVIADPEEQYIITPDSGVLNSLRCLCFPTIISYLKLTRNVLATIRDCVDTVMTTGDGSPGMCQAMLSQQVCDLFFEALSCFTEAFSSPPPSGRLTVGGPDVMGALTAAGGNLGRAVEDRYSSSSMYKAIFVNEELRHSICGFAFWGDWEFDFAAAFDAGLDDVPVESVAAMYPCDRRFLGPTMGTTRGYATWAYRFGVGVFPGSDLDLSLKLKCSTGYDCSESDGYENGECDCNRLGQERVITIHPEGLPQSLSKSDPALSSELFYTLQGSQGTGDVRYDTAVLEYTWTDNMGQRRTDSATCRINQVGGVPPFCSFNPFSMRFECRYGEMPVSMRLKDVKSGAPRNLPPPAYALGERLNVSLLVSQEFPSPPEDENIKHLAYQIFSPQGQLITGNSDSPYPLRTNGEYWKNIRDVAPGDITVTRDWFGPSADVLFDTSSWESNRVRPVPGDDVIEYVRMQENGVPFRGLESFVLEFEGLPSGELRYSVYSAGSARNFRAAEGFVLGPVVADGFSLMGRDITVVPLANQTSLDAMLVVRLSQLPILGVGDKLQVHVRYNPSTQNLCNNSTQAYPFNIKFTAYESDEFGRATDVIAMDYNGNLAEKEATFYAVCADPSALTVSVPQQVDVEPALRILSDAIVLQDDFANRVEWYRLHDESEYMSLKDDFRDEFNQFLGEEVILADRFEAADVPPASASDKQILVGDFDYYLDMMAGYNFAAANASGLADIFRELQVELDNFVHAKSLTGDRIAYAGNFSDLCPHRDDAYSSYYECNSAPRSSFWTNTTGFCFGNKDCYVLPRGTFCEGVQVINRVAQNLSCEVSCPSGWVQNNARECTNPELTCCSRAVIAPPSPRPVQYPNLGWREHYLEQVSDGTMPLVRDLVAFSTFVKGLDGESMAYYRANWGEIRDRMQDFEYNISMHQGNLSAFYFGAPSDVQSWLSALEFEEFINSLSSLGTSTSYLRDQMRITVNDPNAIDLDMWNLIKSVSDAIDERSAIALSIFLQSNPGLLVEDTPIFGMFDASVFVPWFYLWPEQQDNWRAVDVESYGIQLEDFQGNTYLLLDQPSVTAQGIALSVSKQAGDLSFGGNVNLTRPVDVNINIDVRNGTDSVNFQDTKRIKIVCDDSYTLNGYTYVCNSTCSDSMFVTNAFCPGTEVCCRT